MEKIYVISSFEVERRMRAFTTLIISLTIGVIMVGFRVILNYFETATVIIGLIFGIFWIFRLLTLRFFESFLRTRIFINKKILARITTKSEEVWKLNEIKEIDLKRTRRGNIREVEITNKDKRKMFLDGLENFEEFVEVLTSNCGMQAKEYSEKIDYDAELFYVILGICLSMAAGNGMKWMIEQEANVIRVIYLMIGSYVLGVGLYFGIARPLTKRYGDKNQLSDYIFAIAGIVSGLFVLAWLKQF